MNHWLRVGGTFRHSVAGFDGPWLAISQYPNPTAPARCKAVGQLFQSDAVYLVCAKPGGLGQLGKADVHTLRCRTNPLNDLCRDVYVNYGAATRFGS